MTVAVVSLPPGDDPDSYVRREGGPALERLLEQALPVGAWARGYLAGHPNAGLRLTDDGWVHP